MQTDTVIYDFDSPLHFSGRVFYTQDINNNNNNNNAFYLKALSKALKDTAHNNKVQQKTAQVQIIDK